MALADAMQGGLRPSQQIDWKDPDGVVVDLTGATITALIRDRTGTGRAATGTFTLVDADGGVFRWDYSAADVAVAGQFSVQFVATFGTSPTPQKSELMAWRVRESIS